MADLTLNRYIASGSTAARLAFTPSPATPGSGPAFGEVWWDTDLQALFAWNVGTAAWVAVAGSGTVGASAIAQILRRQDDNTRVVMINQGTSGGGGGSGTVTSVALTIAGYTISGSPITTSGTLAATMATGVGAIGSVLLEEHTASSSATLDFMTAFTSAYDEYQIEILNLLPATNNVSVQYLMSSNGGSTWDTGTNYNNNLNVWLAGANVVVSNNAQTAGTLQTNTNNTAGYGLCMSLKLMNPLSTTLNKGLSGTGTSADADSGLRMVGWTVADWYVNTTAAVNAMRFQMSSGNIASGTIRVYGLAK